MKLINKSERGQSLVELAISLVVLMYLLSGVVEFGIAFFQFIQLRDAAQEGALYGSVNPNTDGPIITRVRNASQQPIDLTVTSGPRAVTVTVTALDQNNPATTKALSAACVGDGLRVQVEFDHKIFMPFIPVLIGSNTIHLNGNVTDTILQSTATGCP
jgi:Flp pilus assembly protein TadG